jgi:hypothetical protein
MTRFAVLLAAAVCVLAQAAVAARPIKGATYKGQETKTSLTVSKDGKTVSSLRMDTRGAKAACKPRKAILTALKLTSAGRFSFKGSVASAAGKKVSVVVKGQFYTDYLGEITVTFKAPGCQHGRGDALVKV